MLCNDLLNVKGRGLLLVCCAPCVSGAIDFIAKNHIDMTIFFYNPNIYPQSEYLHRKAEVIRLANIYNIPVIDTDYTPDEYLSATSGMENCPERGNRCTVCFTLRLMKTALYAKSHGFDYFTSTLAFSRWKSLAQVDSCGAKVSEQTGVPYLPVNWRKCGIQETSRRVIRENNLYEQNYCGCVYSYNAMLKRAVTIPPSTTDEKIDAD